MFPDILRSPGRFLEKLEVRGGARPRPPRSARRRRCSPRPPAPRGPARRRPDLHLALDLDGLEVLLRGDVRRERAALRRAAEDDAPAVAAGQFADDPDAVQDAREADEMLDHESPLEEVFEDQLLCADMVLLNKADLLDCDALDCVRAEVRSGVATQVKLVDAVHGAIDPKILLGIGAGVEEIIEGRWSHHDADDDHDHDDFESFVLTIGDIINPEDLEKRIKACAVDHDILRVKGFVNVPGKDMRHVVQAVGARVQRYYDRPWLDGEVRRSSLVIIGEVGLDQDAIGRALDGKFVCRSTRCSLYGS
mgnify:CR=1 FL=1